MVVGSVILKKNVFSSSFASFATFFGGTDVGNVANEAKINFFLRRGGLIGDGISQKMFCFVLHLLQELHFSATNVANEANVDEKQTFFVFPEELAAQKWGRVKIGKMKGWFLLQRRTGYVYIVCLRSLTSNLRFGFIFCPLPYLDCFFQCLACLEGRNMLFFDLHFIASLGIPGIPSGTLLDLEHSEVTQFDAPLFDKRIGDAVNYALDYLLRL